MAFWKHAVMDSPWDATLLLVADLATGRARASRPAPRHEGLKASTPASARTTKMACIRAMSVVELGADTYDCRNL